MWVKCIIIGNYDAKIAWGNSFTGIVAMPDGVDVNDTGRIQKDWSSYSLVKEIVSGGITPEEDFLPSKKTGRVIISGYEETMVPWFWIPTASAKKASDHQTDSNQ